MCFNEEAKSEWHKIADAVLKAEITRNPLIEKMLNAK
jgi:hypothetical protein